MGIVETRLVYTANGATYTIPYINTAVAASKPADSISNPTIAQYRRGLVDQVTTVNGGSIPFVYYEEEHGTNSLGSPYSTLALFKSMMQSRITWLKSWHNAPVAVSTMVPKNSSRDMFKTATEVSTFTASQSGSVLTVTGTVSGLPLEVGMQIVGTYAALSTINSFGTGTGGAGTYNLSASTTQTSQTMRAFNQISATTEMPAGLRYQYNDDLLATRLDGYADYAVDTMSALCQGSSSSISNSYRNKMKVAPFFTTTAAGDNTQDYITQQSTLILTDAPTLGMALAIHPIVASFNITSMSTTGNVITCDANLGALGAELGWVSGLVIIPQQDIGSVTSTKLAGGSAYYMNIISNGANSTFTVSTTPGGTTKTIENFTGSVSVRTAAMSRVVTSVSGSGPYTVTTTTGSSSGTYSKRYTTGYEVRQQYYADGTPGITGLHLTIHANTLVAKTDTLKTRFGKWIN